MQKFLIISFLSLFLVSCSNNQGNLKITEIGSKYNDFQDNFGQKNDKEFELNISNLFAENLKKIANGEVLVSGKSNLAPQLQSIRDAVGGWKIHPKFVIPSSDGKQCTIRYIIDSNKAGKFDIISVLSIDKDGKIYLIDEVYYQISEPKKDH